MSILAIHTLGLFVFAYEQQQRNTATAIRGNLTVTHSNCQKIMKYLCGGEKLTVTFTSFISGLMF